MSIEFLKKFYPIFCKALLCSPIRTKIKNIKNIEQYLQPYKGFGRGCVILINGQLAVMKIPRPLLYTNMTPTKTFIPSEPLNLAF